MIVEEVINSQHNISIMFKILSSGVKRKEKVSPFHESSIEGKVNLSEAKILLDDTNLDKIEEKVKAALESKGDSLMKILDLQRYRTVC